MVIMDNRYAVIDENNLAVNFILWDGVSEYDPGEGLRCVPLVVEKYGFGWIYDPETGAFTDPNPPVEQSVTQPTIEDLQAQLSALTAQINSLVSNQ